MSSTYGENLKLSIFGQSHGPAIGMTLDGIPAGLPVDIEALQQFLARRAPGCNELSTARKEADIPEFLSGIVDDFTCGAPIAAVIRNQDVQSHSYTDIPYIPRPGHADYTADVKYGGFQDVAGGGHFSGRLTAPLCMAGGLCKQWLQKSGIEITGHISSIAGVCDNPSRLNLVQPQIDAIRKDFPVIDEEAARTMRSKILRAKERGDSVGGEIECVITGIPAGIGEPMFGGVESKLAQILYGIPAIKALEFGLGAQISEFRGSMVNDAYETNGYQVTTRTNFCGGILGGITTGMPVIFKVSVKPTPSIALEQQSVDLATMENTTVSVEGRHDPCIVPRVVPVLEAAAAIAIFDLILGNTQTYWRKG